VRHVPQQVQDREVKVMVSKAQKGMPGFLSARARKCVSAGVMTA
jgi:hypothetical protein